MDKIRFKTRGSDIISSINQKRIDEGFPGTEIGLPIDRPNCEGKVITRDDKEVDSITLRPKEWCWFYGKDGTKYVVHNVKGKIRVYKDGNNTKQVKPTKEMLKAVQIVGNESTTVSGVATPTGRLHPEYEYKYDDEDVDESLDESVKEESEDKEETEVPDDAGFETDTENDSESESEDEKEKEETLHTGVFIDKDGKRKLKCPECGSFDVNIHNNGTTFHCVKCGYEWPTKDVDDDGYEDEKEQKDDILVQQEDDEGEEEMSNENRVIIEGFLKDERVNEGVEFKKNKEYVLTKDFGDIKKGTLFFCDKTDGHTVSLTRQDMKSYSIKIPFVIADDIFEVKELQIGKVYTLKRDIYYEKVDYIYGLKWSPEFISKHTKNDGEDYIEFSKGTKFEYKGSDSLRDYFDVEGERVPFDKRDNEGKYKEIFK